jgi:hypothetical protein
MQNNLLCFGMPAYDKCIASDYLKSILVQIVVRFWHVRTLPRVLVAPRHLNSWPKYTQSCLGSGGGGQAIRERQNPNRQ